MPDTADEIRVLIAEDNRDLSAAVCELIAAEAGMRVTGTVARVGDLPDAIRASAAQVLVLDLDLAGESSVPALLALRAQYPQLAAVLYSGADCATITQVAARIGRCEPVAKTGESAPLLDAIRRCADSATAR